MCRLKTRLAQKKAEQLLSRAGASVQQSGELFTSGNLASMTLVWNGTQADGTNGSSTTGLVLDLTTGEAVELARLFDDADAAFAAMEKIISDDVLSELSDYMEYGDLLPMPTDNYAIDEQGLTVFIPTIGIAILTRKTARCSSLGMSWQRISERIVRCMPLRIRSRARMS
ncbi:MAG: hypothetical protein V8Q79_00090 [Christensenellales bacterium]